MFRPNPVPLPQPRRHPGLRAGWTGVLLVSLLLGGIPVLAPAAAPPSANSPFEVKALYLLNFARYVEWPATTFADATTPIRIGVLGRDPFGDYLDHMATRLRVNAHPVEIVRLPVDATQAPVQILYVAADVDWSHLSLRQELLGKPILLVADSTRLLEAGAMVGFRLANDRIVFEIAQDTATAAGLKIGSRMLQSAAVLHRSAAPSPKDQVR